MYSILRPELLYTDVSPDIVEHDDDIEVYKWEYEGKDVYRGSVDPRYMNHNLNVYSLYDENLKRVGIVEHDADELELYEVLWFYDNPFARFYQDPEWTSSGTTLWSMLSPEAYQDCLDDDFKTVIDRCISSKYRLITPDMLLQTPTLYHCSTCGTKSIALLKNCKSVQETDYFSGTQYLYIDDSFVMYTPPTGHRLPTSSYEQGQTEQEQTESAALPE
jgi:hypothetical protein